MAYNINAISFLIASLDDVLENFGANAKSIAFYKNQVNNLVAIGQISQADVNIVMDLINFSYVTDSDKWKIEMAKKNYFVTAMDSLLRANGNKDVAIFIMRNLIAANPNERYKKAQKLVCKILDIPFDFESKTETKQEPIKPCFGTNGFHTGNTNLYSK